MYSSIVLVPIFSTGCNLLIGFNIALQCWRIFIFAGRMLILATVFMVGATLAASPYGPSNGCILSPYGPPNGCIFSPYGPRNELSYLRPYWFSAPSGPSCRMCFQPTGGYH